MGGDYTRFTFNPREDHSGVLMQQGRVQLDADWNEMIEVLDRRWRAETTDIIGRCVVPMETPDGFKIDASGGTFTIGRGRIYVDGLLAENHGAAPLEFDRILAEVRGTQPVPYAQQPYYPNPDPLPAGAGPHLVYVDVWQREVTALEEPDLLEKAVGVDTATRLQTVWQVKALADVGASVTCTTPDNQIPTWWGIIQPSAGRLTTAAVGVPSSDDPCIVPASGGFRGTENRLYRVEIHQAGGQSGGAGTVATFKWSRDNGSIATNVTAINLARDELTVVRTGRDAVLRFNENDWVEVTDDWRELAGQPGIMRKVQHVDDVKRTIRLDAALPAGTFDATDHARHTRVRRWDQKGLVRDPGGNVVADVDANGGVIPVPDAATSIVLEDGVQVTFTTTPAGGTFRVADYWAFAARTADASVEILQEAPPRGIHHHYCRLALVTFPDSETDCRTFWPPEAGEGCCSAVVHPGESIQAALDALPAAGGCVCLKPGVHTINAPIRIEKSNVTLHGETPGAQVRCSNGINLVQIQNPTGGQINDVTVADIRFATTGTNDNTFALIQVQNGIDVAIHNCDLGPFQLNEGILSAFGIVLMNCQRVSIEGNGLHRLLEGIYAEGGGSLHIVRNLLSAPTITTAPALFAVGQIGIWIGDHVNGPCTVERNAVRNYWLGISLAADAAGSIVSQNLVLRPPGGSPPAGTFIYGIDVAAPGCAIQQNSLDLTSPAYGGIRITAPRARVEENWLECTIQAGGFPPGIFAGERTPGADVQADDSVIQGNVLTGRQYAILGSAVDSVQILGNLIIGQGENVPLLAIGLSQVNRALVAGNRIRGAAAGIYLSGGIGNRVLQNHLRGGGTGIGAILQTSLEASGNTAENLRNTGIFGYQLLGTTIVAHNRLDSCAYQPTSIGLALLLSTGEITVESCEVLNTGLSQDGQQVSPAVVWGIAVYLVPSCRILGNHVAYTQNATALNLNNEHRALFVLASGAPGAALILDNSLAGPGLSRLVEIYRLGDAQAFRFDRVTFSNNFCDHLVNHDSTGSQATVSLWGQHVAVLGNQVRASVAKFASFNFNGLARVALVGNVTTGGFVNLASAVPTPPASFNVLL